MTDFLREEFKEKIKNNEYNNISIRIINYSKRAGIKKVIDHKKNETKNISINIPSSHFSMTNFQNKKLSSITLNTNPNNYREKNIFSDIKNNAVVNKITTANLRKIKLNVLKNFGSSSNFKRGENRNNHIIYISKKDDSSKQNYESNDGFVQIMPANKLSTHLTDKTKILYKKSKEPERKKSSLIYPIYNNKTLNLNYNQNLTNNNYIYDSNTFKNPNINITKFKYYKDLLTYKTNGLPKRNDDNNKIFFNNTLTTINEVKKGNMILHKLNKKDLQNMKTSQILSSNNISERNNMNYNSINNSKNFINQIPKTHLVKYGSKDILLEKIKPKLKIRVNQITNIRDNQSIKTMRTSSYSSGNFAQNITNIKHKETQENNKTNEVNIRKRNNIPFIRYMQERINKDNPRSFLNNNNLRDLINKSMDNKEKQRNENFNINRKVHTLRHLSKQNNNKQYCYDKIKEEEKSLEDDSKQQIISEIEPKDIDYFDNNDNKKMNVNNKLNLDKNQNLEIIDSHSLSKTFKETSYSVNKTDRNLNQKNLLKPIYENENLEKNNIHIIKNNTENEKDNLPSEISEKQNPKKAEESKSQISEQIKSIIMDKNILQNKKPRISLTTKKDLKQIFNPQENEENSIKEINTKHINYKGIKYKLVSSLSVKDQLRKYISDRKRNLDKGIHKYQYTEENDQSISSNNNTNTARKDNTLNNYTYLELKDIKNKKRDTFITLHSGGGVKNESRFEELEPTTFVDLKYKIFKPYVSTHPDKKFKKRGVTLTRGKSERKIRGIRFVGNADTIEYQYDKINLSNIKHNPLGKSTRDIHHRRKIGRKLFKRD